MAYLIDTNVLSELRKRARCHPRVANWQSHLDPSEQFISSITLIELRFGFLTARRTDPVFANALELWYENQIKPSFHGRILSVDTAVSEQCSVLLSQRTRQLPDAIIAATAFIHDLTLATRNISDFADAGIRVINPWEFGAG